MKFLNSLKVDKIFNETNGGNIELNEMVKYMRSGDIIFVYSVSTLGKNIKSIIRFIMQTQETNVELFIKNEKFDTSNQLGKYTLTIIAALDEINGKTDLMERTEAQNEKGRMPRELFDLRTYIKLVENNEMSVTEACQKLNIGRTTYYRRCRQLENTIAEGIEDVENETV